jgi:hypothetical protein
MTNIIKKNGFINGIILGVILMAMSGYIYFGDLKLMNSVWFGAIKIVVTVIFGIISILYAKKKSDGLITFREAFSAYFLTIFIGSCIGCLFMIVLFSLVFSPEKIEIIKNIQADFNVYIMKLNYASKEDIDKAIAISKTFDPSSIAVIIKSAMAFLLRDCLIGFLVALIFRNKRTV